MADEYFRPGQGKAPRVRIKPVEATTVSANPKHACTVFVDSLNIVVAKAVRIGRVMLVMGELLFLGVDQTDAAVSAEPEVAFPILYD